MSAISSKSLLGAGIVNSKQLVICQIAGRTSKHLPAILQIYTGKFECHGRETGENIATHPVGFSQSQAKCMIPNSESRWCHNYNWWTAVSPGVSERYVYLLYTLLGISHKWHLQHYKIIIVMQLLTSNRSWEKEKSIWREQNQKRKRLGAIRGSNTGPLAVAISPKQAGIY